MEFPPTTRRQVREALDLASDPEITAVQREDEMYREQDEVDQVLAEVDRELAAEARVEATRVSRTLMPERQARKAARRAERATLRALPSRLGTAERIELDGEAA